MRTHSDFTQTISAADYFFFISRYTYQKSKRIVSVFFCVCDQNGRIRLEFDNEQQFELVVVARCQRCHFDFIIVFLSNVFYIFR